VKKYAEKDEKGEIKLTNGAPGTFTIPDSAKEAFDKDSADLFSIEVKLKWSKLFLEELDEVKLSGSELAALEPVIVYPYDGEDDGKKSDEEKVQ
jgi:hypothetical protein